MRNPPRPYYSEGISSGDGWGATTPLKRGEEGEATPTYESANSNPRSDGGNGPRADVACQSAAGGEEGEEEGGGGAVLLKGKKGRGG